MSDQNKNTGTTNKPGATSGTSGQPSPDSREQATPKAPKHEQGREHTPNVDAQRDAADTRRGTDQSHVPAATTDKGAKPNDRKDNEAVDAERTTAEGQVDRTSGNGEEEPATSTSNSGNR